MPRYAYIPGFGSGPASRKGVTLARALSSAGLNLALLDVNRPSFARLSHQAALEALDDMDRSGQECWNLIGSSWGGWVAARWAELHPDRMQRLVLLCPGFDLATRWPSLVGDEKMREWQAQGDLPFVDVSGNMVPVHYAFYEELTRGPAFPVSPCPTLILHGTRDDVVPVETSRRYAAAHPNVQLIELDDDHALLHSLERVVSEVRRFLSV
jgi:hypothetical protein